MKPPPSGHKSLGQRKRERGGEIEIEREATVKCNIKSSNLVTDFLLLVMLLLEGL